MDNETYAQPHHIEDVRSRSGLESLESVLESSGRKCGGDYGAVAAAATVNGIDLGLREHALRRIRFRCGWSRCFPVIRSWNGGSSH